MKQARIELDLPEELIHQLREVAAEQGRTPAELVDVALSVFFLRQKIVPRWRVRPPLRTTPREQWRAEMEEALARIRESVETDLSPEELDALIDETVKEVRAERYARQRGLTSASDTFSF